MADNLTVDINNSHYHVIDSGCVFFADPKMNMEFTFKFKDVEPYRVEFMFSIAENNNSELRTIRNPGRLTFKCINFKNILGTGPTEPISLF